MKYCIRCGKQNPPEARYCISCGYSFNLGSKWSNFNKSNLILLLFLLVFIGALTDYFFMREPGNEKDPVVSKPTAIWTVSKVSTVPAFQGPTKPKPRVRTPLIAVKKQKKHVSKVDSVPSPQTVPGGMVLIPEGTFMMGSPEGTGLPSEQPRHKVHVKAFYMDKYLVTFDEYDDFCHKTARLPLDDLNFGRGSRPAIGMDWAAANDYAKWFGKRLPTEAEYEWAARGGIDTVYFFGNDPAPLGDYAWYNDNSGNKTHPVGEKRPNPYGLYDILGNVDEWCSDWFGIDYYSVSPVEDPQGPDRGTEKVVRGGSWWGSPNFLRVTCRSAAKPEGGYRQNGFRCVKDVQ